MTTTKRPKTRAEAEKAVRGKARELLTSALPRWHPIRVKAQWNPALPAVAEDWTFRIERDATGETMLDIAMRDIAPETRPTIVSLVKLLDEHALLLGVAVEVARVELGVTEKRTPKPDPVLDREREEHWAALLEEAKALRAENPRLSNTDIARRLATRHGGGAEYIRKRLPRRRKLGQP